MKLRCAILSMDGQLYDGEADFIVVQAYDGEMGFLYNHAPLVAELGTGELRLMSKEKVEYFVVEGGVVHIRDNDITVLADKAISKDVLVAEDLSKSVQELKEQQSKEADWGVKVRLDVELRKMKARLKVALR